MPDRGSRQGDQEGVACGIVADPADHLDSGARRCRRQGDLAGAATRSDGISCAPGKHTYDDDHG
jgi:hypothetical protein